MIFPQLQTTVYDFILFFSGVCVYLCSSSEADMIIVCCVSSQGCVENRGEFLGRACGHHGPYIPDVLFWSVILFFSTVAMSSLLKEFKTSRYFPTKARILCVVQVHVSGGRGLHGVSEEGGVIWVQGSHGPGGKSCWAVWRSGLWSSGTVFLMVGAGRDW